VHYDRFSVWDADVVLSDAGFGLGGIYSLVSGLNAYAEYGRASRAALSSLYTGR
jgi:hypothetical protein